MAMPVECACGRKIGTKVFKQHGRKCTAMLVSWGKPGSCRSIWLLDERTRFPPGCTCPSKKYRMQVCQVCQDSVKK